MRKEEAALRSRGPEQAQCLPVWKHVYKRVYTHVYKRVYVSTTCLSKRAHRFNAQVFRRVWKEHRQVCALFCFNANALCIFLHDDA